MIRAPIRILLVDDVRLFRELEKTFLQRSGHEVIMAATGAEALEKAREYQPRLILLDCQMPVMDGIECCRRIKGDPALRDIKVIMVTTRGSDDNRRKCIEAGCDGYLTKPIKRREFLSRIEAALYVPVRGSERLPISIKVTYASRSGLEGTGVTLNLSSTGLFVVTEEPVATGTPLSLSFNLPGIDDCFDLEAEVVWNTNGLSSRSVSSGGFGARFTAINVDTARQIENFVSERLT
ncbi:MAG: response regulator [Myxococcota bacterium]